MKKYIFLDMDGTLAMIYKDPDFMLNMYKKDFFSSLSPYHNMVTAIKYLYYLTKDNDSFEIFTLSTKNKSKYCELDKNKWLDIIIPEIDSCHRIYVDEGKEKYEYIKNLNKYCILIDDHTPNLLSWTSHGGTGIKFVNEINRNHYKWKGNLIHYNMNPSTIIANIILSI